MANFSVDFTPPKNRLNMCHQNLLHHILHAEVQSKQRKLSPSAHLSGSHRSTHIASDLASQALASQAKPQRESESQAFCIARS